LKILTAVLMLLILIAVIVVKSISALTLQIKTEMKMFQLYPISMKMMHTQILYLKTILIVMMTHLKQFI